MYHFTRQLLSLILLLMFYNGAEGRHIVVADSVTHDPLARASIFSVNGTFIGLGDSFGNLPYISSSDFPVTVRYMGYKERTVDAVMPDTIFMQENPMELNEVVVSSLSRKALHILAYVREYSTMSTYTDTVFLFREKTVDVMIPEQAKTKYAGWRTPRVLFSKSYYRFTNEMGLDSVSDACTHHFSWADWVGISPDAALPQTIAESRVGSDTISGKYGITEKWLRNGDKVRLDVNILNDTTSRKWVPNLSTFFRHDLDYETFKLQINYENVTGTSVSPQDVSGYSFNIESNGRGRAMFMFNKVDQPIYVTTYAEVYILDREFITIADARKWERRDVDFSNIGIIEAGAAPPLQEAVVRLIERVNEVDRDGVRLTVAPDQRLAGMRVARSFGSEMLTRLKNMFGISYIRGKRKQEKKWKEFRRSRSKDFDIIRLPADSVPGDIKIVP
ncbi:MAG: carboxypeptidase-like regulatory domain-containing protein [Muribaculaceae bacterium]|nr:carboxypeptidase-like regulatory domain-containing protein [Muribaculaceae bacterium]